MTEKELSQLYWLNRETEKLQEDLKKLKSNGLYGLYKSPMITDMPKGAAQEDKIATYVSERLDLPGIIATNLAKIFHERNRLERYIDNIEDAEMRLIMRLRHINGLTWESIGNELGYTKQGVNKKYKSYFRKS